MTTVQKKDYEGYNDINEFINSEHISHLLTLYTRSSCDAIPSIKLNEILQLKNTSTSHVINDPNRFYIDKDKLTNFKSTGELFFIVSLEDPAVKKFITIIENLDKQLKNTMSIIRHH